MPVNSGIDTKKERGRALLEQACDAYAAGNLAEAVRQFQQAARLGNPNAQINLGNLYDAGEGVEMSFKFAAHYYRLAAKKGLPEAAYNLAFAYKNRGNDKWAKFWFRRASEMGDTDATAELTCDAKDLCQ